MSDTMSSAQMMRPRRLKVFLPVDVELAGQVARAHFLDISAHGAKAHMEAAPRANQPVITIWDNRRFSGKVAWVQEKRFGIVFDEPLPAFIVEDMLG